MLKRAFIPYRGYYSTPFCRWQGAMANENAIALGAKTAGHWISLSLTPPWTGLLVAILFAVVTMVQAVAVETSNVSPVPPQAANPEALQDAQAGTQADESQRYPNLLDGTLSGKGDQEDNDSPHVGLFRRPTLLKPWFDFKQQVRDEHGFVFGGSYGVLWQNYSQSLVDERNAVGGRFALNAGYALFNRGKPNALWFEVVVEDRHRIGTEMAPLQAGMSSGSAVPTASSWGEFDIGITQAYIRQNLLNNRVQYAVGRLFAPNFINAYPFFDDNRQFLNQSFSTSPTMLGGPTRGFGLVGALHPIEDSKLYMLAGMYTANSRDTGWTVDEFFTKREHFYHVELGWSGLARTGVPVQSRGAMDRDNFHITPWYKNKQENGSPEAYGIAFNANRMFGANFMGFLRGGWADGSPVDGNASAGVGWRPTHTTSDLFGLGLGWAHPSDNALRDQYTAEVFYRFHVTPNLAITPDVQLVMNPARDPSHDSLWVFGMRTRVVF